jgi:hypothetical protein
MTMKPQSKRIVALVAVTAVVASGCGDDGDGSSSARERDELDAALVHCLESAGARPAADNRQLREIVTAVSPENTNNVGVASTLRSSVDVFEPVLSDGVPIGGQDFLIYVLRPLESKKRGPAEALDAADTEVFVLRRPSPAAAKRAQGCLPT